jgi:hypothetical protein
MSIPGGHHELVHRGAEEVRGIQRALAPQGVLDVRPVRGHHRDRPGHHRRGDQVPVPRDPLLPGDPAARLHDTGRSGGWIFIGLVPLVGGIILLVFTVSDSKPGANQYGPNPKEIDGVPAHV